MSNPPLRRTVLACGAALLLLVLGAALARAPGAALAQTMPPRPTLAPIQPPDEERPRATPVPAGRITGTVIDQRTGAPAPGVAVRVGAAVVSSDTNGNYDLNGLAPASYPVALRLTEGQGHAAQGEAAAVLGAGQTVVLHLFFTSPAPAVEAAPASEASALPATLPATGARGPAGAGLLLVGLGLLGAGLAARRIGRH